MRPFIQIIGLRARVRSSPSANSSSSIGRPRHDTRAFHVSSAAARRVNLVAPPDPISNLRPVLYDQPVPDASTVVESGDGTTSAGRSSAPSPYSMSEFSSTSEDDAAARLFDMARLRKERVDAKNHEFWATTNILFKSHLERRLSLLPSTATPEEIEAVKTNFHRDWVAANKTRMDDWVKFWWADIRRDMLDSLRRVIARQ